MSTELLKAIADSNQWWAIGPEMILACAALGLLVLEIILPKDQHRFIPVVAVLSLLAVLIGVILNFGAIRGGEELFGGLIRLSLAGQIARVFFLFASLACRERGCRGWNSPTSCWS
jgi:NADH-quinone oxidoreductase subunit N